MYVQVFLIIRYEKLQEKMAKDTRPDKKWTKGITVQQAHDDLTFQKTGQLGKKCKQINKQKIMTYGLLKCSGHTCRMMV